MNSVTYPRQIRSFMRREGRLSDNKKQVLENFWEFYGLTLTEKPLDLDRIFQRSAPRILEIGFGMGQSFLEQAEKNPEQDFIGIEVHRPGIAAVLTSVAKNELTNIRLFNHDAVGILKNCFAENSLDKIQIYFPDPWPKKRHHKRRLIQLSFVDLLWEKLKLHGTLHLATDWEDYAMHMMKTITDSNKFINVSGENQFAPRPEERPLTKFELRGQKLGHGVWDLLFTRGKGA